MFLEQCRHEAHHSTSLQQCELSVELKKRSGCEMSRAARSKLAGLGLLASTIVFIVATVLNVNYIIDPDIGGWLAAFAATGVISCGPLTLILYFSNLRHTA
jgi:hypothetical protein